MIVNEAMVQFGEAGGSSIGGGEERWMGGWQKM